ncbi:MAG: LysR substrate-binding domain-containing protein [Gammaproteobacteria bacterium]|nr:LysR substrate-binding domain-containing protein [Gammaproteobacteria bacterium]MDH4311602.1 LysR substrate-binding domain-containing protein [Gammaproteobacteria bacterium]MDH5274236.1 LysR substrate-binding domain-containing protein [Gammaproteobacteria bacterium]
MDLNSTRMFVGVVQAGSLSAAAARLNLPLPTISRRIRQLEQQLKVQLLERSPKGITLTDAGARLYEHASRGLESLAEGAEAVRSDQARLKGRLRLSIPPSMEPWWELLGAFQQQYPDIRISVFSTERRVDLIQDGIDVALRIGAIVDESMVASRMGSYRHVLVASPRLLTRLRTPRTADALQRFPCAVWVPGASAQSVWNLGEAVFAADAVLSSNDYLHLRACALRGEVVTELPPFLAHEALARGELVRVLPRLKLPEVSINLLYPSHRHPSSLVRAYLSYCRERADHYLQAVSGSDTLRQRGLARS